MRLGLSGLLALWITVFLALAGALMLALTSEHESFGVATGLSLFVGASFSLCGLVAWWRRPFNLTGALMVAVGLTWLASFLSAAGSSLLFTAGLAIAALPLAILLHLLLAFPTGRLPRGLPRILVVLTYLDTVVLQVAWLLFFEIREPACPCPENALLVWPEANVAEGIDIGQRALGLVVVVGTIVLLLRRWRLASVAARRALAPVLLTGALSGMLLAAWLVAIEVSQEAEDLTWRIFLVSLASVPLAFLAGLLRARLARSAVGELVVELGAGGEPHRLRDSLRRALGDPTLTLAYWLPEAESYVDIEGQPVELPAPGTPQAATVVERSGKRVAALVHDAALLEQPELVDAVCAAAGLALENERLQADLRARLEELRAERDFVTTVVDTAASLVCVLDREGRVLRFNRACELVSGYSAHEVKGRHISELIKEPGEAAGVDEALASVVAGDFPNVHENHWVTKSGERRLIVWMNSPLLDREGAVEFVVSTGLDVTEQRRADAELRESEARFRELANNAPVMIWLTDGDGKVTFLNRGWLDFTGRSEEEELGWGWVDSVHPADRERAVGYYTRAMSENEPYENEYRLRRADGEYRWVLDRGTPRLLPDGAVAGHMGITVDITERKQAEEALRASRARIVEAGDAVRRRLERNLHDGAQQRLVSLSLSLRMAQARLGSDPKQTETILRAASEELGQALQELRELARGIHPAILTDRGLEAAVEALTARSALRIDVDVSLEERLPGPVEAAAYYIVSEAIANVTKYSEASAARVNVAREDSRVLVEVADDGVGGADPSRGSGLRGLADRVEALDGRLDVRSPRGRGTTIRAEIPV